MEMDIRFPGGARIETEVDGFRVSTDQPVADGGSGTAPSPFDLFLASLGTCAGYYVIAFCRQRQLPTQGLALKMEGDWNTKRHLFDTLRMTLTLPPDFPKKYRGAVVRAAEKCTVKRHMETPPLFEITTVSATEA
jgi:ribosomal protein S12 methylthiotransferase accessory factor